MSEAKWYGVSSGNGNDGVSHMFADYYVKTNEPYRLAELALITLYKPEFQAWAKDRAEIEGESEYTIYATHRESRETEQERVRLQERAEEAWRELDEYDAESDGGASQAELEQFAHDAERDAENYGCDYAETIIEVFPSDPDEQREWRPTYESLEECFGDDCKLVEPESV